MKRKLLIIILFFSFIFIPKVYAEDISISYKSHVENIGWQKYTNDGQMSGTSGRALRMEAVKIKINNTPVSGNIEYQAHVEDIGWQKTVKNDEIGGTTGKGKRIEAIKINLTDELAEYYDVEYRTHVQNIGWTSWKKNGELSGTTGRALRLEAIEIKLTQKKEISDIPKYTNLSYSSYVNNAWQEYRNEGITGTTNEGLTISGLKIKLDSNEGGSVEYQVYSNNNWTNYLSSDTQAGNLINKIEAIKIRLTNSLANKYDIYYRVHSSNVGWFDWTKNDTIAGCIGYFYGIEAIEIKILPKDSTEINVGSNVSKISNNSINYSSHVSNIGWQNYVSDGKLSGTTGKGLKIEALKLNIDSKLGSVQYNSYVQNKGWQNYVNNNEVSGTTGLNKRIEAIKVKLTGSLVDNYDIYYRVHVSDIGWLGWAKNDEISGSIGNNTQIEALEMRLVPKNVSAPGSTEKHYVTGTWKNNNLNYYNYFGNKVTGWQYIDGKKYYFNSDGDLKGSNVKKVIDVSSYQQNINWDTIKYNSDIDHVILRIGWGMSYDDAPGTDSQFDYNIRSVQRLGIPYSIYIFSYARVESAAEKEAKFTKEMMEKYNIPKSTFIWYDTERPYDLATYKTVIPKYVNTMHSYGYNNVGVYGSVINFLNGNLNDNTIKNYPLWIAQYYKNLQYPGNYIGWQYTSDGSVEGINGRVDISMFK